jgi:hypothetical protein
VTVPVISPSLCEACVHYQGARGCPAWNFGVPARIMYFGDHHLADQDNDHGIHFQQGQQPAQQAAAIAWNDARVAAGLVAIDLTVHPGGGQGKG